MDSESHYYRELTSRSRGDLGALSSVCADYNKMLKSALSDQRKEMDERFLALIQQYHAIGGAPAESLPFRPKTTRASRDCVTVTYDLSKLPCDLQLLLIEYMRDCLASSPVV